MHNVRNGDSSLFCDPLCGAMLVAWKLLILDRNCSVEDVTQEIESTHFKVICFHLREEAAAAAAADDDDDDHAVRYQVLWFARV